MSPGGTFRNLYNGQPVRLLASDLTVGNRTARFQKTGGDARKSPIGIFDSLDHPGLGTCQGIGPNG